MPGQEAYDNGIDCFADTYSVLLSDIGADPRILGVEWGYVYPRNESDGTVPFTRFRTRRYDYAHAIERWYGVTERRISHPDLAGLWQYVCDVLAGGRLVAVNVDTFDYPYSPFYERIHHLHRIVVKESGPGRVYVVDDLPGRPVRDWMDTEELNRALDTPQLANRTWAGGTRCTIDLPAAAGVQHPTTERLREALVTNVDDYLTGSAYPQCPTGDFAVRQFLVDVRAFAERDLVLEEFMVARGVTFFGTLARQRRQNALFVELVGDRAGVDLAEVTDGFREISYRMDRLRAVFFFGVSVKRPLRKILGHVADNLEGAFQTERELVTLLRERLR